MNNLSNKTILVIGACSGIGKGIVTSLDQAGARLLLHGRNLHKLQDLQNTLINRNEHTTCIGDLSNDASMEEMVSSLPTLDGLIYNAGVIKTLPVKYITRPAIEEIFNVNVFGGMLLVKLLSKQKKINQGASLCFISSIAARYVHVGNSIYSASKGALNSFVRSIALELAPRQIRVNSISPGLIETKLIDHIGAGIVNDEKLQDHLKNYPLGRYGMPEDVGGLAVFLMSNVSSWMTGTDITLDGGYSIK